MDKDREIAQVWAERTAANLIRIAVVKKYGRLKPHLTNEVSLALRDRAKKLGGR